MTTTVPQDELRQFTVVDGAGRSINFVGALLAEVTTQRASSPRWVEYSLWRTYAGKYVLKRAGRSRVYHGPGCGSARQGLQKNPPSADGVPCNDCWPSENDSLYPEVDRLYVSVVEKPEDVIGGLVRPGEAGLSFTAQRLLGLAAVHDEGISEAWGTSFVE